MAKFIEGQRVKLARNPEAVGTIDEKKPGGRYVVDWDDEELVKAAGLTSKTISSIQLEPAVALEEAIIAMLELGFGDPEKPYTTQRAAREAAMRVLGFNQAQANLRSMLIQAGRADLAAHQHENALAPSVVGARANSITLWVPPQFPVKGR